MVKHVEKSDRAEQRRRHFMWSLGGLLVVIVVAMGLRLGTDIIEIGQRDNVTRFRYDERWITTPIDDLIARGWSVETAIDFEETKGPGLIWPYAVFGKIVGNDLNDLRALSLFLFVCGAIALLWMAVRCGIEGWALVGVAGLYALLPYNALLGQLVMSEPLFNLTALILAVVFLWGIGAGGGRGHRVAGPVLFGVLLSIALHNRLHAVAFAGAACLVAFERDRFRSWPWWVACMVAGVSRLPLWSRWGGPVSPRFQNQHDLGLGLESLTYLSVAMVPFLAVFLVPIVIEMVQARRFVRDHWPVVAGGALGIVLGVIAMPDLGQKFPFEGGTIARYLGTMASLVRSAGGSEGAQGIMLTVLAAIGLSSLGAVATLSWRISARDTTGIVGRVLVWSLLTGWAMYALTAASVFDRYILPWAILLPVVYVRMLPRWLVMVQAVLLAGIAAQHVWGWLIIH